MSVADEKKFSLSYSFMDVTDMKFNTYQISNTVEYFGCSWTFQLRPYSRNLSVSLECKPNDEMKPWTVWSISTNFDVLLKGVKVTSPSKSFVFHKNRLFTSIDAVVIPMDTVKKCLAGLCLAVEIQVTIAESSGIEREIYRDFMSETARELSDVVLVVNNQKFHVCKMYLSTHSSYFKALFSGNFSESQKSEIELKDIDAKEFQHFLELLYGESLVDDNTVVAILKLADFFDSKTAIQRCEEFLVNRTEQPLKFQFHAAVKYNMKELKTKCMYLMKSREDFRSLAPENAADFNPEVWKELYSKVVNTI